MGRPFRSRKHDGPLNSAIQRERVEGHVQRAIEQGAKLLVGGKRSDRHDKGYFYEPTAVIADENSDIAQNEVFGPVQTLIGYEDEADMIRIANNSRYGLSGGIMGLDVEKAMEVAAKVRTGTLGLRRRLLQLDVPSAATRSRASAASTASSGSRSISRPRRSRFRRAEFLVRARREARTNPYRAGREVGWDFALERELSKFMVTPSMD